MQKMFWFMFVMIAIAAMISLYANYTSCLEDGKKLYQCTAIMNGKNSGYNDMDIHINGQ